MSISPENFLNSFISKHINYYYSMYTLPDAKLAVFDQIFNVIGNGINSQEEFIQCIFIKTTELDLNKFSDNKFNNNNLIKFSPYPNFQKKYTILFDLDFDIFAEHKIEWINYLINYYQYCDEYLNSENSNNHNNAFPSNKENRDDFNSQDLHKRLSNNYTGFNEGLVDTYCKIAKDYGVDSFNGDIRQLFSDMWIKDKQNWLAFIKEAIYYLNSLK
jgi:hypothetical protein